MLDYILLSTLFLLLYRKFKLFLITRKDYENATVMKGAEPVYIEKGSKRGLLLIHGFTSTPQEFHELINYFKRYNFTIYCPLLIGHGTTPAHLASTNWLDWLKDSEKALNKLGKHCKEITLIGNSAGGNLALLLANKHKVKSVVLLGTPMFFKTQRLVKTFLPILSRIKVYQKKKYPDHIKKIIKDKVHYPVVPLNNVYSVLRLMKESRKVLPKVDKPTLILQSSTDLMINKENAFFIRNNIKTKEKKVKFIPESYHVFIMDANRQEAFEEIKDFLKMY